MTPSVLFLIFSPPVLSAALNPFKSLNNDPNLMDSLIFNYLELSQQVKFMLTCRDNYKLLEFEYDFIFEQLTNKKISYSSASKELKSDVVKLWRLLVLESNQRNSYKTFTFEKFFKIINDFKPDDEVGFFLNPFVSSLIKNENEKAYKSIYGSLKNPLYYIKHYEIPHFPNISLLLIDSSPLDFEKRRILIENAAVSPYLFNEFFKYLAEEFYKVPRHKLPEKISSDFGRNIKLMEVLRKYQNLSRTVFFFVQHQSAFIIWVIFLFISEKFLISNDYTVIISALLFEIIFGYFYYGRYDKFEDLSWLEVFIFSHRPRKTNFILELLDYEYKA